MISLDLLDMQLDAAERDLRQAYAEHHKIAAYKLEWRCAAIRAAIDRLEDETL